MFFKMLKNDLKAHKGLNIILFIFIVCSTVITVVATNLMYMELTGRKTTDKVTNVANITMNCLVGMGDFEEKGDKLKEWIDSNDMLRGGEIKEYVQLSDSEVCINGIYASDDSFPEHDIFHLTTQSKNYNLLFDDKDEPFSVDTGEVAITLDVADLAGVKRGDKLRVTTQLGDIYEFTVSEIYKNPSIANCEELVVSDADFEKLKGDMPFRLYKMLLDAKSITYSGKLEKQLTDADLVMGLSTWEYTPEIDMNYTIVVAISYFLVVLSVVIILIMLFTIRLMMMAAIKQEEKELGMMRAIGVDSMKYRWMFAATYLTFSIIGGLAGITAGSAISRIVIRQFCKNMIQTSHSRVYAIAILVSVLIVAIILLFSALMMRRINKISVIETIHGSDDGERFGKLSRMTLYKSKKLKVPSFLAVGNIVNSFGKYAFLIITYMMAMAVIIFVFDLQSTLFSHEYIKNFLQVRMDFTYRVYGDMANYYYQKGGDYIGAMDLIVKESNDIGVPVKYRYVCSTNGEALRENHDDLSIRILFGDTNNERYPLRKGGKLPIHENELIMSYFTAKKEGMKIGDKMTLKFNEYDDDHIGYHEVTKEFIITGFYNIMEEGNPTVILGEEYTGAVEDDYFITDTWIDAPKREHKKYIKKLKEYFGDEYIRTYKEVRESNFAYILRPIQALKIVLGIMVAFILSLNTLLYTTVDLEFETPQVAMLKCVGFSLKDLRKWQIIRMGIILLLAYILANIFEFTGGNLFAEKVFETFSITGFRFVPNMLDKLVIIPGIIFGVVILAFRLCLRRINKINIWNIREE